ncbi:hypothetical protein [Paenibacillus shenyangensis]|uniref:hypothetical protein n=1 Tax=Paenibacillus sp. A9 TaxID=1284352 RepID=UPI00036149BF|nr:hypothetical protein [Paenibacillus sp. A9]
MKKNNKYLLKLWVPIVLLITFGSMSLLLGMVKDPFILIGPFMLIVVLFIIKFRMGKKLINALQKDTPEPFIRAMIAPAKRISQKDIREASLAYNTALAYVIYGQYEEAVQIMDNINWGTKEPIYQALPHNIRSLIHYFSGEITAGLASARKARALASVSVFPGAKKSMETYDTYVEIGQILSGINIDEHINNIQIKYEKLPLLPKLIASWGLLNGYAQQHDMNKSRIMLEYCQSIAPHCKPLHLTQESSPPASILL